MQIYSIHECLLFSPSYLHIGVTTLIKRGRPSPAGQSRSPPASTTASGSLCSLGPGPICQLQCCSPWTVPDTSAPACKNTDGGQKQVPALGAVHCAVIPLMMSAKKPVTRSKLNQMD